MYVHQEADLRLGRAAVDAGGLLPHRGHHLADAQLLDAVPGYQLHRCQRRKGNLNKATCICQLPVGD